MQISEVETLIMTACHGIKAAHCPTDVVFYPESDEEFEAWSKLSVVSLT